MNVEKRNNMINDSDIILYINKVRAFINSDNEALVYFYHKNNEEEFYALLSLTAKKNIETNGIPDLTSKQFEEIRKKLSYNVENTDAIKNIVKNLKLSLN